MVYDLIMQHFLVSLDEEAIKIWNKIPKGERSQFVREQLKGRKEEVASSDPKGLVDLLLSENSTNSASLQRKSSKHENTYSGMEHMPCKNKKKNYSPKVKNIADLLSKA